ncbi:hypothetical protein D6T63_17665 [Arthrobacter cheniae]|uniref:Uncharacterized protein n=1 Tax=Arthrobacter cheniae TaxID=1258888 RepID=A0A3A5M6J7_9MICC|nr:hypothetical protein D6T63_17665 [Arthrobacter cheniae]
MAEPRGCHLVDPYAGRPYRCLREGITAGIPYRGQKIIFGVWVSIHPLDLQRAFSIWHEPEYAELKLTGRLANAIEPWGLLRAPVDIAVVNADHTPYCVSSTDAELSFLLHNEWSHQSLDQVLERYDRTGGGCAHPVGDHPDGLTGLHC